MNATHRTYLIGVVFLIVGLLFLMSISSQEDEWDLRAPIREMSAMTERIKAEATSDPVAIMRARRAAEVAAQPASEAFAGQRIMAYCLLGLGALCFLGAFISAGSGARSEPSAEPDKPTP